MQILVEYDNQSQYIIGTFLIDNIVKGECYISFDVYVARVWEPAFDWANYKHSGNNNNYTELLISFYLKWDGCHEFSLADESLHLCGKRYMYQFTDVLNKCYEFAAQNLDTYDQYTAE